MALDPSKPYGAMAPAILFSDVTYIHDEQTVLRIQRHCVAHGCVADISYDEAHQEWIWHTIYRRGKTKLQKEIASRFIPPAVSSRDSEAGLLAEVAAHFRGHGIPVDCEVVCAAGIADMVTCARDAVFEVKYALTRAVLYQAVGQVLIYRQAINPAARAIIVGRSASATTELRPFVEQLGVELMLWSPVDGFISDGR
jgi:hypothetical protein